MIETTASPDVEDKNTSKYYYTIRYAILGAVFGLMFPIVATLIVLFETGTPISLSAVAAAHYFEPLLWIIDTAPVFLGFFAAMAGRREDRLQKSRRQLKEHVSSLEERVTSTSRDLDRAVEVGHTVTHVSDLEEMLAQAVELIRSSFELYYVQVYLLDDGSHQLTLGAGTGDVGRALVGQNHKLPLSLGSIVGSAAVEKQTIVVPNTATSEVHQPNPYLPDTCSEMAMPLLIGEQVVGVIDLQSDEPGKLTAEKLPVLEAVAGQLAIAIQNARLVAEATRARADIEVQVRRIAQSGWQDFLNAVERNEHIGYAYESGNIVPIEDALSIQTDSDALTIPILVTGAPIGSIQIQGRKNQPWSRDEKEIASAVAEQIARQVESMRLLAEADYYRTEAEEASRRLTREGWEEYLTEHEPQEGGFVYDLNRVNPLTAEPNGDKSAGTTLAQALMVRGEAVGRLEVTQAQDMDDGATELVAAVAEQLSAHLESLRLSEQTERALANTERQAQRLAVLNELSQALAGAATIEDVYKITALKLNQIIPSNRISIAIVSSGGDSFEILALHGEKGATKVGDVKLTEGSALAKAVTQQRVVTVNQSGEGGLPGIESFMVAPLTAGGQTFGTLNIGQNKPDAFDDRDRGLLLQVASLLASTLESQRLFDETVHRADELAVISQTAQARASELAILNEMGQALTSLTDVESIMNTVHNHTARLMDANSFYIALFDAERNEVDFRFFGDKEEIDESMLQRRAGNGITEYVIRTQEPLLISDNMAKRIKELGIELHGKTAMSWLGVPMMTGDRVAGVMAVQNFRRESAYDDHHRDLLSTVANQAAIAIDNARLFEQAQSRARHEQLLREISARVRSSVDVDSVMRTAAQEVGRALGRQTFVYLGDSDDGHPVEAVEEK